MISDRDLRTSLREHYKLKSENSRYTAESHRALLKILFESLAGRNPEYYRYFSPQGLPQNDWNLSKAQGALEGAEYTEAARGKRCGHIFKAQEVTYSCRTCAVDDTCVLCAKCFEASDHDGHQVTVHSSAGATGCCDCGDPEAWTRPLHCSIHTASHGRSERHDLIDRPQRTTKLPRDLVESIRATLGCTFDFICDVFSCASETMHPPRDEISIRQNEEGSRLSESRYGTGVPLDDSDNVFALILWNDEKHTIDEVRDQVARACRKPRTYGQEKAAQVDSVGRSIVDVSANVQQLLDSAAILEQIKVTVTIRSARDTFREGMCGTIIDWLADIAGCSVGDDHRILMNTICEEMLMPWRMGSSALNIRVGGRGLHDHSQSDSRLDDQRRVLMQRQLEAFRRATAAQARRRAAALQEAQLAAGLNNPVRVAPFENNNDDDGDNENDDEDDDNADDDNEDDGDNSEDTGGAQGDDATFEEATDAMDIGEMFEDDDGERDAMMLEATVEGEDGTMPLVQVPLDIADLLAIPTGRMSPPRQDVNQEMDDEPDDDPLLGSDGTPEPQSLLGNIPKTPKVDASRIASSPPSYWGDTGSRSAAQRTGAIPIFEDVNQRLRLDFLVLYDLRMWKTLRNNLRHLYISTVATVPYFKRALGLRFAAIYTWLAQMYLIADREPEHSIISLSLQMLTTGSIAKEIVEKQNFLTKLLAILYTFLTKRQVGHPNDVDVGASISFESGVLTNRRIGHFFADIRYLLESKYVQEQVRSRDEYLLQFLDFVKLYEGMCTNVRATNAHVEYESDTWVAATSIGTRVTQVSRQFCAAFQWNRMQDASSICRAIRQTAKVAIISSMGVEHDRFRQTEFDRLTTFEPLELFDYEKQTATQPAHMHSVVDSVVERDAMSFHHQLHHMLSWLIDSGKSMSQQQLRGLLEFTQHQLQVSDPRSPPTPHVPAQSSSEYSLALFDIPLRVCAWTAQIKAGMWVRNGMAVKGQLAQYRSIGQREYSFQRDLFLLQVALVAVAPSEVVASIIARFGMTQWMRGNFEINPGWEDHQMIDVAEDFIQLFIHLLCERFMLVPKSEEPNIEQLMAEREIAHVLLFKPLSHSDLYKGLPDSTTDLEDFEDVLRRVATFRAPEGLQDAGVFTLKPEHLDAVDPYNPYFSKNQREEAESIWRTQTARKESKDPSQVVYEARPPRVKSGIFSSMPDFIHTPIFAQVVYSSLRLTLSFGQVGRLPDTRLEAFLPLVLHLTLVAINEDHQQEQPSRTANSFTDHCLMMISLAGSSPQSSILALLLQLRKSEHHQANRPKISMALKRLSEKRPAGFQAAIAMLGSVAQLELEDWSLDSEVAALAEKKRQAKARQEKVMAAFRKQQNEFLQNQAASERSVDGEEIYEDDEEEEEGFVHVEASKSLWHFPTGTCIFCQEETTEQKLYGTLAYISESRILRQTPLEDADYVAESLAVPTSLDQADEDTRPFGVASQNLQQVSKVSSTGEIVVSERRGLGKGFPCGHSRPGPVATSCGHIMHYACFEQYNTATQRRHSFQAARNHPERLELNEFVCPLCKALGNSFLPIIWKAKEMVDPASIQSGSFEQWINAQVPYLTSNGAVFPQYQKIFQNYTAEFLNPQIASRLGEMGRTNSLASSLSSFEVPASRFQMPAFLSAGTATDPRGLARPLSAGSSRTSATNPATELLNSYHRLQKTMHDNHIWSRFTYGRFANSEDELTNTDSLAKSLGFSISAVEISLRGVERTGASLISSIPEAMLTHLKILSETTQSYVAIGGLQSISGAGSYKPAPEIPLCSNHQLRQLLGAASATDEHVGPLDPTSAQPLLSQDMFVFLAECSMYLIPHLRLDTHHVLRLCLLAEVVKVVLAFLEQPMALWRLAKSSQEREGPLFGARDMQVFSGFVQHIVQERAFSGLVEEGERRSVLPELENPNERFAFDSKLRIAVQKHCVVFLRKSLILLHVRFGVEFESQAEPATAGGQTPDETERLLKMMGLPSIDDLLLSVMADSKSTSTTLQRLVHHWITHWSASHCKTESYKRPQATQQLQVSHPGVFELVALPTAFDVLNTEVVARRCPTTGGEIKDPSLCLFCGAIFCGQAECCRRRAPNSANGHSEGGCMQHQEKCGGNIGMYLNIRKCAGLFLHRSNGTWMPAPYLDQYGEHDYGLRRRGLLWLNSKRWDKLFRDTWLSHGVPSNVARRLEGDINTGGWETL